MKRKLLARAPETLGEVEVFPDITYGDLATHARIQAIKEAMEEMSLQREFEHKKSKLVDAALRRLVIDPGKLKKNLSPAEQRNIIFSYWREIEGRTDAKIRDRWHELGVRPKLRTDSKVKAARTVKVNCIRGKKLIERLADECVDSTTKT